ncbi:hypothetical protein P3R38_07510 [Pseudomonas sp. NyZ480]|uniref:hypothetical protein n=1 Tax=Pseudomonas sp. NyZ480 TaxID=3035289 RepID=UPI00240942F6|nr:hypothetical protein [Pseudomonas sp. NyZ480]WEZ90107.1 hypothetical protein P3R38_07510 [Pseudomonas sp. NyZ480]
MGSKRFALSVAVCLGLAGQAQADAVVVSGMLQFTGSIVEPSCTTTAGTGGWRMEACPALARDSVIGIQGVDDLAVPVRALRVDRGPTVDQAYRLVDERGEPPTQGHYVVILTSP